MKYPKIKSLDLENKILIVCLGIGVLTIIFLWVYKHSKIIEGNGVMATDPMPEGPLDISGTVGVTVGVNALLTEVAIESDAAINTGVMMAQEETDTTRMMALEQTDSSIEMAQEEKDTALMIANQIKEGELDRKSGLLESVDSKVLGKVQMATGAASTAADMAVQTAQLANLNSQQQLRGLADSAAAATSTGMQTHGWKIALLGFLAASGIGAWAISNIEVLIYRITNFKSCFFWYFLEIIGWLLYLPIEFIVWLFCLQDFEKYAWKGLDGLDCFINGIIGFYLFKHSDAVNQKCYSRVFTPFPSLAIPFSFDTIGNYMNDMYEETLAVPAVFGGEEQILANVDKANNDAKVGYETAIALDSVMIATTGAQIGVETAQALIP